MQSIRTMTMRMIGVLLVVLLMGINSSMAQDRPGAWQPVVNTIEADTLDDLVVVVGTADDGVVFTHAKGGLGALAPSIAMPIASSSKWFTSATILRLVDEGVMSLDDNPQDYIAWWASDPTDPRSQITLGQLLSFTSGFSGEPFCIQNGRVIPEDCARTIYNDHHTYSPNTTFYYSSTHMHVAGVMAVNATGESFNDLFRRLVADPLGMSNATRFDRPSATNPFLAGGARSSANDYALFLQGLLADDLLQPATRDLMFQDWTSAPIEIASSPLAEYWHYGLGVWRECWNVSGWVSACEERMLLSGGGGLGWFPWIDLDEGYYGVIARRGLPLSGAVGPSIELSYNLRPLIEVALDETAN